jgi:hypothetical protein
MTTTIEKIDRYTGLRNAARALIETADLTPRTAGGLCTVPTDAVQRLATALDAAPTFTDPFAKAGETAAEDVRNALQLLADLAGIEPVLRSALAKLEPSSIYTQARVSQGEPVIGDAVVRLMPPISKRPVAFVATTAGRRCPFYAFPERGCFFGIDCTSTGRMVLLAVAMMQDGSPVLDEGDPDICEVTSLLEPSDEDGDDALLDEINEFFGTAFARSDFPGR